MKTPCKEVQQHPMLGACMRGNATLAWLTFGVSYKPRLHNMSYVTRHTEPPPPRALNPNPTPRYLNPGAQTTGHPLQPYTWGCPPSPPSLPLTPTLQHCERPIPIAGKLSAQRAR